MIVKEVEVSTAFKSQATRAISSILLFVLVYFLLFVLAITLMGACVYYGVNMIVNLPRLFTIAIGIGLISSAFFVLLFLFKFIFKTNKTDRSHLIEITKNDEPKIFKIIDEIVKEVGTSFPKKIYLSSEVNASVFYDSSFWSMFLPVEKNLLIGMGLVNTVSEEELRAILAHEFGHFSQRSMKVGSYVYNVNHIIFNMLYDNESYDKMVEKWGNSSGYFGIFIVLAMKIVEGIKWILQKIYEVVNKNYLALSREMEFHADEIAANVTGYLPLKKGLLRLSLADSCLNNVLSFYEMNMSKSIVSKNIYSEQSFVMQFLANEDKMILSNGLPLVTLDDLNKYNKSKLIIEDQWASHPSTEDRIKRLAEKVSIDRKNNNELLANDLFTNVLITQEQITAKLFSTVKYESEPKPNTLQEFKKSFKEQFSKNVFPDIFNEYYDLKNPISFEVDEVIELANKKPLTALFSDEMVNAVYTANALETDIETLKLIVDKTIKIKIFEYDGKKYKRKESGKLLVQIKDQFDKITKKIKLNDINIFNHFLSLEGDNRDSSKLISHYKELFNYDRKYNIYNEENIKLYKMMDFIHLKTPYDTIISNFKKVRKAESKIKNNLNELLLSKRFDTEITDEMRKNFDRYLSKDWDYFTGKIYIDENLEMLFTVLNDYSYVLSRGYFVVKKELLEYKNTLIK